MRTNSTTTKPTAANRPHRKAPIYQTANELRLAFGTGDANARELLSARTLAMAQYLLKTPASEMLIELLQIACGKAWRHNRENHSIRMSDAMAFEDETRAHNIAIIRAIEFVRGDREDDDLKQELDDLVQRRSQHHGTSPAYKVMSIEEWKWMNSWRKPS